MDADDEVVLARTEARNDDESSSDAPLALPTAQRAAGSGSSLMCTCGERAEAPSALMCETCARLVHPDCLPRNEQEMPLPGDLSYLYRCPTCNTESLGQHLLRRYGKSWAETAHVALWNLIQDAKRYWHHLELPNARRV